jgi:hypothetical protein
MAKSNKKSLLPDELAAQVEKLNELSDDDLSALGTALNEHFEELEKDLSDSNLQAMEEITTHAQTVRETLTARAEDRAARQDKAAELRSRMAVVPEPAPAPTGTEPAPAEVPSQEAVPAAEVPAEPAPEPVPVAAGATPAPAPSLGDLQDRVPASRQPSAANERLVIRAAADVPDFSAGQVFDAPNEVAKALALKWEAITAGGQNVPINSRFPVASFRTPYPDELTLDRNIDSNTEKVSNVMASVRERIERSKRGEFANIVASGGLCAPVDIHYGLAQIATADRPFRDSIPKFATGRGGIQFITPPTLSQVSGAIGITTAAQDAAGYTTQGGPTATKPIVSVSCGTLKTVNIAAVSLRLQIGNFSRYTFQEQWDAWYANALAMHARVAEGNLLALLSADTATIHVVQGQLLGAARDLAESHRKLAAQFRNRFRTGRNAPLQMWQPGWVIDMVAADLLRQQPGDGLDETFLGITEAWWRSVYAAFNVDLNFYEDTRTGGDQIYGTQNDNAAALPWITTVE